MMKRIVILLTVISAFASLPAYAVDTFVFGEFNLHAGYLDNPLFLKDDTSADGSFFSQRFQVGAKFVKDEEISGLILAQIGPFNWGDAGYGYNHEMAPADYGRIGVLFAFLEWKPREDFNVVAGLQRIELPSAAFGNPVFAAKAGGANTTWLISENLAFNAVFAQTLYNPEDPFGTSISSDNKEYIAAASLDIRKIGFTPWFVYGNAGNQAFNAFSPDYGRYGHTSTYVGGAAFKFSAADKLSIGLDAMYGIAESDSDGADPFETKGFTVVLRTDYSLGFGKLGVYGWYGSGSDKDDAAQNRYGVLPVLGGDGNFTATTFGFAGSYNFSMHDSLISFSPVGMWAAGLMFDELSFIDKLTHKIAATYMVGTNEKETPDTFLYFAGPGIQFLTTGDSVTEFDFTTIYQVTDGLTFAVELAYFLNNFSKVSDGGRGEADNGFVGQFGIKYAF